jgi:hypothetical protein
MTPIKLKLPADAVVAGEILRSYAGIPGRLSQDILHVRLTSGVSIDVGWLPRFDPAGRFEIAVYAGDDWDNQLVEPIQTESPFDAALTVQQLAYDYSHPRPARAGSAAASTFEKVIRPSGRLDLSVKPAA